jgi:hypothetical protein
MEDPGRRIELDAPGVFPIDFLALAMTPLGRPVVRVALGVGPPVL